MRMTKERAKRRQSRRGLSINTVEKAFTKDMNLYFQRQGASGRIQRGIQGGGVVRF